MNDFISGKLDFAAFARGLPSHPDLSIFDNMVQWHACSGTVMSLDSLARWLIKRANIVGVRCAIEDLERYVKSETVPALEVMALAGVTVAELVKLSDGVSLCPLDMLPDGSGSLKQLVADDFGGRWRRAKPAAFLQRCLSYPRQHLPHNEAPKYQQEPGSVGLEDVRLCMTAIGPSTPVAVASWIQDEEWVPGSEGGGFAHLQESIDMGGVPIGESVSDWSTLPALYRQWVARTEAEKKHLRIALSRLNFAMRRLQPVDAAIDLGIAMDALFLSERAERGEHTFTLRLRAARWLGADKAARVRVAKAFSALISLRGSAVHSGTVRDKQGREILSQGFDLMGQALRRAISEGLPDWNDIVLD